MYSIDTVSQEKRIALLRSVRERLGWSRAQLAAHLGKSEQSVLLWEAGRVSISPELTHWLVTVDEILKDAAAKQRTSEVVDALLVGGLVGLIVGLLLGGDKPKRR